MRFFFLLSILSIFWGACGTNIMTLSVTEPAPVTIPADVRKAAIIARTKVTKDNDVLNKIDQVLSIEGKVLDSLGAQACLVGLYDDLIQNQRFDSVVLLDSFELENPNLRQAAAPLNWNKVAAICQAQQVDLLFVLEHYDTDTKIAYSTVPVTITTPIGLEVPGLEHQAQVTTFINTTWRIYDPLTKTIYDEFPGTRRFVSVGKGINPTVAIQAIKNRKNLVEQNSREIGSLYARRLLPYRIRVSRDYFVGGSPNFKIAKRRAQTGNWDGAAELWLQESKSDKRIPAGRGAYNMAISNEINGNLEEAIRWAQKAYEDYNIREALDYVKILRNRQAKRRLLEVQGRQ
ncbi:DUF6340 family protein [Aureispira sp. CCB-E]|uniref:DUF6340 family protein n=1 Tax=Aureispira sp. CCB-E TaxID=3051121 RepID=UPI002869341B|nr:DUF6340 family protein [Aureispira sp. CCB-E]WMX17536.1 DUF6340 family protein [Aureispira sp. CCB-E]